MLAEVEVYGSPSLCTVLETDHIMSTSKQLDGVDLMWKLNCVVWASVDQQDRSKPYVKADNDAMKEYSLQASLHD